MVTEGMLAVIAFAARSGEGGYTPIEQLEVFRSVAGSVALPTEWKRAVSDARLWLTTARLSFSHRLLRSPSADIRSKACNALGNLFRHSPRFYATFHR